MVLLARLLLRTRGRARWLRGPSFSMRMAVGCTRRSADGRVSGFEHYAVGDRRDDVRGAGPPIQSILYYRGSSYPSPSCPCPSPDVSRDMLWWLLWALWGPGRQGCVLYVLLHPRYTPLQHHHVGCSVPNPHPGGYTTQPRMAPRQMLRACVAGGGSGEGAMLHPQLLRFLPRLPGLLRGPGGVAMRRCRGGSPRQ